MEDKPMLLIDIDQSGKCTLNPEALEIIRGIEENISVVSVAGLYRTGKSYLLNRLMGNQHGFEIGPSVNPCTKGIWIWGAPISLPNKKLILIDTEGLGSFDRDQTIDMIIFSLSVLISSTFIYNSMGTIDEQALEDLSLVCKLTQHVHVKSHQGSTSAEAYAQYFPKFIWALRDFSLQLVDKDGGAITSDKYLNLALEPVSEKNEESKGKNEIRKVLREFFRDRECFTFVRPVNQEKKLRNIQEVPFEELRQEFRDQVSRFVDLVLKGSKVKMIDGVAVTGRYMSSLLEIYVDAINRDAVPTITTAWERTIDAQVKEAYKSALSKYKKSTKRIKAKLPLDDSQLRSSEHSARQKALALIDAVPIISSLKDEISKIRSKFNEKCESSLESLVNQNYQVSKSKANAALKDIFEALEDKIIASDKLHFVPEDFAGIFEKLTNESHGPGQFQALAEAYAKDGSRIIMKLISQITKLHKQDLRSLQQEIDSERDRFEKSLKNYEEFKKELAEKGEYERKHFREQKMLLENALEDARLALSGNSEEFAAMQKKLRQENVELARQVTEANKKPAVQVVQPDITGIKDFIQKLVKDSSDLKQDNSLNELKLEYEMKLTNVEKIAQKQVMESKKMSDQVVMQLKKSYEKEIKDLKNEISMFELKMKDFAQEILKRDMQIKVLNQKFRGREEERKLRIDQSDLLISVSELIIKFLRKLETGKGGDLREEINVLQGKNLHRTSQ